MNYLSVASGSLLLLMICHEPSAGQELRYDSAGADISAGAVLKIATGEGVGILYRKRISRELDFRVRIDVLFASSHVETEFNYAEVRPGISHDIPLSKVVAYVGGDGFFGYFQNAINKKATHYELGLCPVVGARTYVLFDRMRIGFETGPKIGYRVKRSVGDMRLWNNHLFTDLFLYLTFSF